MANIKPSEISSILQMQLQNMSNKVTNPSEHKTEKKYKTKIYGKH